MKFGICTTLDHAPAAKAAGWDYIEECVQTLLQGELPEAQWDGLARVKASPLPVLSANMLVPASIKITGPDARIENLREYMTAVLKRAALVGIHTLVFGSGGARNVPDNFDRNNARQQIIEFAKMSADLALEYKVTIVLEHLNQTECNIVNSVKE